MTVVFHILAIAGGLAATLACFLVLEVAGLVLVPRRWHPFVLRDGMPAVLGGAVYVLACWFGIEYGVRQGPISLGFVVCSLALLLLRHRSVASAKDRLLSVTRARWIALFAGLYVVAYLFVLPPPSSEHLPIAWLGNVDLFQYLVYARYLFYLGPSPLADVSTHSYVYYQTPGAFFVLDAVSLPFRQDPMRAAMPTLFAAAALTGVAAAHVSRRVFGLPFATASLVGAVMVVGPFFRFIMGHYYLSTLLALPVMLHLFLITVLWRGRGGGQTLALGVAFLCHDVLLLFIYPYLLVIALGFQAAAVGLAALMSWQDGTPARDVIRRAILEGAAAVVAFVGLGALAWKHLIWVSRMLRELSHTGLWGWATDVISPFALVGVPAVMTRTHAGGPRSHAVFTAVLWLLGAAALAASMLRFRRSREQRVFLGLAGFGLLAYAGYLWLVGPSYQQWKLASYTALPLSFVLIAAILPVPIPAAGDYVPIGRRSDAFRRARVAAICVALLGGNAVVHAIADPGFFELPGSLRNLAQLDALPFRDLSVEVQEVTPALLVSYFLPSKRLHVSMPRFIPDEPIVLDAVSPVRPLLLLNYGCEGIGHQHVRAVDGAGCLAYSPPSLAAYTAYPFSHTYMFIEPVGFGPREDGGRWNRRSTVALNLMADPRRLDFESDGAWLNLLLRPNVPAGTPGQRVRMAWGAGRRADVLLVEAGWISLPLRAGDWSGERLARQTVSFQLLDASGVRQAQPGSPAPRVVVFEELSVSAQPRGRTVSPAH